ncbi:beta subunit of citrate lyase [Sistotremastrum suecicum HHB10207 ss-3]|uniref:Beta subunit of citrate lyase n=1 Tax=Sistotremastrum suecicum HHB10207 ss-3 TaxID=1314776 RepID=A0A166FH59_9AGAM|nr:beta subunit of citrate lyase [Sistotremastrum suecicum HHB10207 ss-3]
MLRLTSTFKSTSQARNICRNISTVPNAYFDRPRRSYLYVPASSDRMLNKSLQTDADTIIYDLEDSVAPASKSTARSGLVDFLQSSAHLPPRDRVAVRVNDFTTENFAFDIEALKTIHKHVSTIVIPKVEDLGPFESIAGHSWNVVASIESAASMWNIGNIASWNKTNVGSSVSLVALLFAAEDYCATASIQRSRSRLELLYPRSQMVTAAKAFGLHAIDMVNVNYQDEEYMRDECEDGRRLGFDGKQAIHPSQVALINKIYAPSEQAILRAAKIVHHMRRFHESGSGAFGLTLEGDYKGRKEMIDAPMLKQV